MHFLKKKSLLTEIFYFFAFVLLAIIWGLGQYPDFFYIRFFGFIPFLFIIFYRKHYLIETLLFGWIAYIINFYWLYITFRESGKLPIIFALLIPLALCLYYALQYLLISFIYKKIYKFNKCLLYSFPIIFVSIDFLFPKLFTHSIADSQIGFTYFVQLIDITGMTGLILIIMYINLGLFQLINKLFSKTKIKIFDFIFILPLILALAYGFLRLDYLEKKEKTLKTSYASMIQGNITGKQKMDPKYFNINVNRYNNLTKQAVQDNSPDFIIWPESVFTRAYDGTSESLRQLIHDDYPSLILGITFWKNRNITNSCFLIKNRKQIKRYDKNHLLAFGEYLPMEKTFPFLKKLTPLNYSMKKGSTQSIFHIKKNVKACISICFEDIFPDEMRKKVNEGCNLMINITNDSWYGKGLGPVHHSILARLRGIENRRSFFRCTATGLTTASDYTGKIIAKGNMWQEQIISARLPLYERRSLYSYIGETFSYLCVILVLIIILIIIRNHFTNKTPKFTKQKKSIHQLKREGKQCRSLKKIFTTKSCLKNSR